MWRRIWQIGQMALLFAGLGCQHSKTATTPKPPPDPLLMSKKPIEGRSTAYETTTTSWRQPQPPDAPVRETVVQQPNLGRPVPVGYRPVDEAGAGISKPRSLPDEQ
jgi:hypothetical protein